MVLFSGVMEEDQHTFRALLALCLLASVLLFLRIRINKRRRALPRAI